MTGRILAKMDKDVMWKYLNANERRERLARWWLRNKTRDMKGKEYIKGFLHDVLEIDHGFQIGDFKRYLIKLPMIEMFGLVTAPTPVIYISDFKRNIRTKIIFETAYYSFDVKQYRIKV